MFVIIISVLNMIYIPLKLAFNELGKPLDTLYLSLYHFPNLIYLLHIIITLNTAFYDKGRVNYNRKNILINYIKKDFILDIILLIPIFMA